MDHGQPLRGQYCTSTSIVNLTVYIYSVYTLYDIDRPSTYFLLYHVTKHHYSVNRMAIVYFILNHNNDIYIASIITDRFYINGLEIALTLLNDQLKSISF